MAGERVWQDNPEDTTITISTNINNINSSNKNNLMEVQLLRPYAME
jgi:hypothetical protein